MIGYGNISQSVEAFKRYTHNVLTKTKAPEHMLDGHIDMPISRMFNEAKAGDSQAITSFSGDMLDIIKIVQHDTDAFYPEVMAFLNSYTKEEMQTLKPKLAIYADHGDKVVGYGIERDSNGNLTAVDCTVVKIVLGCDFRPDRYGFRFITAYPVTTSEYERMSAYGDRTVIYGGVEQTLNFKKV